MISHWFDSAETRAPGLQHREACALSIQPPRPVMMTERLAVGRPGVSGDGDGDGWMEMGLPRGFEPNQRVLNWPKILNCG